MGIEYNGILVGIVDLNLIYALGVGCGGLGTLCFPHQLCMHPQTISS